MEWAETEQYKNTIITLMAAEAQMPATANYAKIMKSFTHVDNHK